MNSASVVHNGGVTQVNVFIVHVYIHLKACVVYAIMNMHDLGSKAPAKRSQHFNATYRNIVMCCDMLGVAGSSLKLVQIFMQHLWMLHNVVPVARGRPLKHTQHAARNPTQQCCNMLRQNAAIVWPGLKCIKTHIMAFV